MLLLLAGLLLEGWLQAQEQVVHFRQETVIEEDKLKGELTVEHLRWIPSIAARERTGRGQGEAV